MAVAVVVAAVTCPGVMPPGVADVPLPVVARTTRAHRHFGRVPVMVAGSQELLQSAAPWRRLVTRAVASAMPAGPAAGASSAVWVDALVDAGAAATGTAASGPACSGAATLPGSCRYSPRSAPPTGGTRCRTTTTTTSITPMTRRPAVTS